MFCFSSSLLQQFCGSAFYMIPVNSSWKPRILTRCLKLQRSNDSRFRAGLNQLPSCIFRNQLRLNLELPPAVIVGQNMWARHFRSLRTRLKKCAGLHFLFQQKMSHGKLTRYLFCFFFPFVTCNMWHEFVVAKTFPANYFICFALEKASRGHPLFHTFHARLTSIQEVKDLLAKTREGVNRAVGGPTANIECKYSIGIFFWYVLKFSVATRSSN